VKYPSFLVTSDGLELTIIELMWSLIAWIVGLESTYHHIPKILATKMRFHRNFPKGKVNSIKMGEFVGMVNIRHVGVRYSTCKRIII
jgi:hypothetical protein